MANFPSSLSETKPLETPDLLRSYASATPVHPTVDTHRLVQLLRDAVHVGQHACDVGRRREGSWTDKKFGFQIQGNS